MGFKVLGFEEAVNVCDCCGKSDLKGTFGVELENGEILYYGSVCVTRNTGKSRREITADIKADEQRRIDEARAEYRALPVGHAYAAKQAEARALDLRGRPFAEFCRTERVADEAAITEIAAKYKVGRYTFS